MDPFSWFALVVRDERAEPRDFGGYLSRCKNLDLLEKIGVARRERTRFIYELITLLRASRGNTNVAYDVAFS